MMVPTRRHGLSGTPSASMSALITSAANQYGVPPSIALAVANQESGFNQSAVGTSGEIGVFQLMPATAAGLGVNPSDLTQNVDGGVSLLSSLYKQYGNWNDALIAYNEGPTALNAGTVYSSSQSYADSILAASGVSDTTSSESTDLTDLSGDSTGDSGLFGLSTLQLAIGGALVLGLLYEAMG